VKYLEINEWKHLQASNAFLIENITANPGEYEVLFPSGTEFFI